MKKSELLRSLKAPISEIFASFQGEGIFAGEPQVFVRFAGCNLRCGYCDTRESQTLKEDQRYFSIEQILQIVREKSKKPLSGDKGSFPRTVALTGGEPLLYSDFLSRLLPEIKKARFATYLETNGTLAECMKRVRKWVDAVAMDIKLASDCDENYWKKHERFLEAAKGKVFVKLILTGRTTDSEVRKAVGVVRKSSKYISFVLQPATPGEGSESAAPQKIAAWAKMARKRLTNVSITPQMHRIWEVK